MKWNMYCASFLFVKMHLPMYLLTPLFLSTISSVSEDRWHSRVMHGISKVLRTPFGSCGDYTWGRDTGHTQCIRKIYEYSYHLVPNNIRNKQLTKSHVGLTCLRKTMNLGDQSHESRPLEAIEISLLTSNFICLHCPCHPYSHLYYITLLFIIFHVCVVSPLICMFPLLKYLYTI